MKNKIFIKIALVLGVILVLTSAMVGCDDGKAQGEAIATYPPSDLRPDTYSDCVQLGQYKGIEVEKNLIPSDQEIFSKYISMLKTVKFEQIKDRATENTDAINLDYTLYVDGKKFEGGEVKGTTFILGANLFIDGFEEACIGKMPGKEFDINISFPDPYEPNPDLAGKPVKFVVKINYIYPPLTDETAKLVSNGQYASAEDLYNTVKSEIQQGNEAGWNNKLKNKVIMTTCENAVIRYFPDGTIENYKNHQKKGAEEADMKLWEYLGTTEENCDEYLDEMAEKNVGMELVLHAIAEKESIVVYETEYEAMLGEYATYGFESGAEMVEKYGREYIIETILMNKVTDFLVQNAVIVEK